MDLEHRQRRIVVGVTQSAASLAALRWAAREAGLRRARLQVVRAWEDMAKQRAPYAAVPRGHNEDAADARADLRRAVQSVLGTPMPDMVGLEVVEGLVARVLLDYAAGADLLVIGCGRDWALTGVGAVVASCLRHAPCPVTVVTTGAAGLTARPPELALVPGQRRGGP
jgi:nucleotide-binding universal stress UspA family protein